MPGEKREVEAATARKYAEAYPKEFDIYEPASIKIEAPEIEVSEIEVSDKVKSMIKGIKGLGVKSAVQLFIETEALTEEEQIKVIEDYEVEDYEVEA